MESGDRSSELAELICLRNLVPLLKTQLAELNKELSKERATSSQLSKLGQGYRIKLDSLESTEHLNGELSSEVQRHSRDCVDLRHKNVFLTSELEQARITIQELKLSLQESQQVIQTQTERFQGIIRKQSTENGALNERIKHERSRSLAVRAKRKSAAKAESSCARARREANKWKVRCNEAETRCVIAETKLERVKVELDVATRSLCEAESELETLSKTFGANHLKKDCSTEAEVMVLRKELLGKQKQVGLLKSKLSDQQDLESRLRQTKSQCEAYKEEIQQAHEAMACMQDRLDVNQHLILELQSQIEKRATRRKKMEVIRKAKMLPTDEESLLSHPVLLQTGDLAPYRLFCDVSHEVKTCRANGIEPEPELLHVYRQLEDHLLI